MNKKLVFLFASALAIAGCMKEQQVGESVDPEVQEANFSLLASSDQFTKTELCNCKDIVWKSDDQLSVWEAGSTTNVNVQLTLDESSAETQTGIFKGTLTPAADFELYAIYPYNESYGDDPTALSLTIPSIVNQTTDINSIVGDTDFMLGKATNEEYDSELAAYKMLFKHPLAFVQFHIDGRDCVYEQATIKSLTMTADVAFVGPVNVNLEDGTVASAAEGTDGKTLVINFPNTAKMNDPQDAWVAINPVDLSAANCKFALEMTNGQKVTFTVNPSKMNGQALYKFEFKDIDAKIAAMKGEATPVRIDNYNGTYDPANCYLVTEGGYYQFDARSVDKVNLFSGSAPYSDGYRVNWLWSTGTECILDEVGIGDSGRITIRVKPNSNGNAVIALYNPEGNIVWSWHIWATTLDNPMEPHHWSRGTDWLMADINIGATSKTDGDTGAYGMYYQWGRKDPFPADRTNCVFNEGVSFTSESAYNTATITNSVEYAVAHPTVFLKQFYHSWLSTETEVLNAQSLWYKATNRTGKTKYDPCPPGYLVPVGAADYGWRSTNFMNDNITYKDQGIVYTNNSVSTYYPAAGYINEGTLTDAGKIVRLWGADLSVTPAYKANLQARSLMITISSQSVVTYQSSRTGWGFPVRCMKK